MTDQIRTRTGHLPGVSIAVMGCIVNGPGEMADADFGCALPLPGHFMPRSLPPSPLPLLPPLLLQLRSLGEQVAPAHTWDFPVRTCCSLPPPHPHSLAFSYVGGSPGLIDLYVGKEVVRRGVAMETACDELIELIKVRGRGDRSGWGCRGGGGRGGPEDGVIVVGRDGASLSWCGPAGAATPVW